MIKNSEKSMFDFDWSTVDNLIIDSVKVKNGIKFLEKFEKINSFFIDEYKIKFINLIAINYIQYTEAIESRDIYISKAFNQRIIKILHEYKAESICDELSIACLLIFRIDNIISDRERFYTHGNAKNEFKSFLRLLEKYRPNPNSLSRTDTDKNKITIQVDGFREFEHGNYILNQLRYIILRSNEDQMLKKYIGYTVDELHNENNSLHFDNEVKLLRNKFESFCWMLLINIIDKTVIKKIEKQNLLATMLNFCRIYKKSMFENLSRENIADNVRKHIAYHNFSDFTKNKKPGNIPRKKR